MKSIENSYIYLLIYFLYLRLSIAEKLTANNHVLLFDPDSLTVAVGETKSTTIQLVSEQDDPIDVSFVYTDDRYPTTDYIKPLKSIHFPRHPSHLQIVLLITGLRPGHLFVGCNATPILNNNLTEKDFLRINIGRSTKLDRLITTIGWLCFIAWSCSFYPQIILNYRRQSVVGLSFDFLALNLVGYFCYSIYNVAFYSWRNVQNEYVKLNPHGIIPVLINDVVFSLHGFIISLIIIFQCLFFKRSKQRISYITVILITLSVIFLFITTALTTVGRIDLLLLIYFYSYVTLFVCCIKYIPQVMMNSRYQSTEGWSIGNILFDILGGSLSLTQMFLLAINYNDWLSILGSITKFTLASVSIIFDLIFIIQHYILYRNKRQRTDGYEILDNNERSTIDTINS